MNYRNLRMCYPDIECPCCGDVGAVSDNDGYYHDGQDTVCECVGLFVSFCSETQPDISGECTVDHD